VTLSFTLKNIAKVTFSLSFDWGWLFSTDDQPSGKKSTAEPNMAMVLSSQHAFFWFDFELDTLRSSKPVPLVYRQRNWETERWIICGHPTSGRQTRTRIEICCSFHTAFLFIVVYYGRIYVWHKNYLLIIFKHAVKYSHIIHHHYPSLQFFHLPNWNSVPIKQ
jgi:hypothetical protein